MTTKFKTTESEWHRQWKLYYLEEHSAQLEVQIGSHICDVLLPNGQIMEIQRKPLPRHEIEAREVEYQDRLNWVYDSKFFLNRIVDHQNEKFSDQDFALLPIDYRFRFVGKTNSIVFHREPVWIEFKSCFYRLITWQFNGRFYGKFKERIDSY